MIPSLHPVTAGGGLELAEFVALAARHGFKGAELDLNASLNLGLEATQEIFESNGVVPVNFGLPVEWRKDDNHFLAGLENLAEHAHFVQRLGVSRCCTWVLPASPEGESAELYASRSTERFVKIAQILAEYNIALGLEFIGPHHFRSEPERIWFYDIPRALEAVENINDEAGTDNVGLLVDCFHWHTSEASAMDLAALPLERIVHVHINDAPANLKVAEIKDGERELPGTTGTIDLTAFLTTLHNIGYEGPVSPEVFNADLKQMNSEDAARLTAESTKKAFERAGLEF